MSAIPPPLTATADAELGAEVDRLRTLLERQPSCLMRVGVDGRLLAVSDAALSLLGTADLEHVLNTSLVDRVAGDDAAAVWTEFVNRASNAGAASLECELTEPDGLRRAVALQAVTLSSHPDGEPSLLVSARDVSTSRRLQASLQEHEEVRRQLEQQLAEVTAERDRLRSAVEAASVLLAQHVDRRGSHT